jgi:hypothetical protein
LAELDGSKFYDNNGGYGVNFRLIPYKGYASNAIAAKHPTNENSKLYYVFREILPYKITESL